MTTALTGKSTSVADVSAEGAAIRSAALPRNAQGLAALVELLVCPSCGSDCIATSKSTKLSCTQCALAFPATGSGRTQIPWMFADPEATRLEWKARYHGFLHANSLELERLRDARDAAPSSKLARQRISQLLQAREQHRNQIGSIVAPLDLDDIDWPADAASLLQSKLPATQGLSSYVGNVFRDWSWDNGENEAQLAAVEKVLAASAGEPIGSVLTLGAGASRLPYDLHRRYAPDLSVVLDFNPLLLLIASQVIQGGKLSLYEFPIAPLDAASYAVLQECAAPSALQNDDFYFVLADAMNPPFGAGSFDTVVTPWLIDIVPEDLRTLIPHINRCLGEGGIWVNTGSLAFFHRNEAWRYSEEELLELVEQCGFEILAAERQNLPYLQSPHSAYGRVENVLSFSARKLRDIDVPPPRPYLPEWILDTRLPVPTSTQIGVSSSHHLLKAQVLATVDGKRTINQIARILARQYGLGKRATIQAVTRILTDNWERSLRTESRNEL